tara:strand:- start:3384 stop:3698 length:315 start_codon:yes stop_codon:yes gene_type:complete
MKGSPGPVSPRARAGLVPHRSRKTNARLAANAGTGASNLSFINGIEGNMVNIPSRKFWVGAVNRRPPSWAEQAVQAGEEKLSIKTHGHLLKPYLKPEAEGVKDD